MNKDLLAIFEYLEREKGIKRDIIIHAIEDALVTAARKSIKGVGTVHVVINQKNAEIEVLAEKEVMETVTIPEEEITLEEAREIEPDCEIGQWINVPITPENFGRIAAQTARQVIAQKLRSAERDVIYEEYRHRLHEIISGTVKRIGKGNTLIVDLGKVEAILPARFYPKIERYNVGDRIQALLLEVRDREDGGAEVVLSRTHPEMVEQLFIHEVPELGDKTITIEKIARDAGYRTKLAVSSSDAKVDPLGACVGVRGTRVKNIIRELGGEKIDIVHYTDNPIELLQRLLEPIEIKKMMIDDEENAITIVVSDEDYPIVIGKRGANARLNAEMIEAELLVKKASEYDEEVSEEQSAMATAESPELDEKLVIEGVNQFVIESLIEAGFNTRRKLLETTSKTLAKTASISEEMATEILEKARNT